MAKKIQRCAWADNSSSEYIRYHDEEWGVPVWDDQTQFEFLLLEGAPVSYTHLTLPTKREV